MTRKTRFLALVLAVAAFGGAGLYRTALAGPREEIFRSFPQKERWTYSATARTYSGGGLAEYGVRSGLVTREEWSVAVPKIERDLVAAGFRRTRSLPGLLRWEKPGATAFAMRPGMPYKDDLVRVSVTARPTLVGATRSWVRDQIRGVK